MRNTVKIIKRGKLVFVIDKQKNSVVFGNDSRLNQWSVYNVYTNWNRQALTEFIRRIIKSKPDELTTPTEVVCLAQECGVKSSGTTRPKELDNENSVSR